MVRSEFGTDLRHMTPANIREFLDRVQPQVDTPPRPNGGRIHLRETESSYEGILRDFFQRVLEMPSDQAVILLWLYALEMASASVTDLESERLHALFAGMIPLDGVD